MKLTPHQKLLFKNRQERTHYAIRAKRALGRYVPSSGPVENGEGIYNRMRNDLINARVGISPDHSAVANLHYSLAHSSDPKKLLNIYANMTGINKRRARMTARRIAHRLGYIPVREDDGERHKRHMVQRNSLNKYTANIAMDVRAYGTVTILAKNPQSALKMMTAKYIAENFEPHGSGDDIAYDHPSDILTTSFVDEETEQQCPEIDDEISIPDGPWIMDPVCEKCTVTRPYLLDMVKRGDDEAKALLSLLKA